VSNGTSEESTANVEGATKQMEGLKTDVVPQRG